MIEANLIISDFDETVRKLARKGVSADEVTAVRDAILSQRSLLQKVEELRAERNSLSKGIGQLMASGDKDAAEAQKQRVTAMKSEMEALEADLRVAEEGARDKLLRLPNFPSDDCPDGFDEEDNIIRETVGYDAADYAGNDYKPHWEVASALGIMEMERAAKITGSMFSVLRGDGARLMRALVEFGLRLNEDTYEDFVVPTLVNSKTFTGTGHLPKFKEDAYKLDGEDLWMIPTGEVPLTAMHRDEIIPGDELPKRYMTYTSCFRREAGSAGKDTRGMQRLHEFHKVELVRMCKPEDSQAEFEAMLEDALKPIKALGLPYRILDLCGGDLTFSGTRIFDIEVYSPGVDRWLEVSSVGQFTDFQMRRSNIRFRRAAGEKPEFPFILNGSGLATPRVWSAVVEHYQQEDGSIRVPEALQGYMGKDVIKARG